MRGLRGIGFAWLLCLAACGGGGTDGNTEASAGGTVGDTPAATLPVSPTSAASSPSSESTPTASPSTTPPSKSPKRGIAYDLADSRDFSVLSPGVGWWYNWSATANGGTPADAASRLRMEFVPMLWNGNFNDAQVIDRLKNQPSIRYLLVLNEPNLVDQANLTPQQAAALWPRYEAIAQQTGVKLVGPAMTWGTMPGYADPVAWLDAFHAAYRAAHGNRNPRIDYLAFHWYDYGLGGQLDRLAKYGKPFWVTEFANWHSRHDGAQIDSEAKQLAQMRDMVNTCETRSDVYRYAWFTGRWSDPARFTSLLGAPGVLTALGRQYIGLPWAAP